MGQLKMEYCNVREPDKIIKKWKKWDGGRDSSKNFQLPRAIGYSG